MKHKELSYRLNAIMLAVFFVSISLAGKGQLVIKSIPLTVADKALVYSEGDISYSDTVKIVNNGVMELQGNWTNESSGDHVFVNGSLGKVVFSGASQSINGTVTRFPALELSGKGTKTLNVNTEIENTLLIDYTEFNMNGYIADILSSELNAVSSSNTGYVNTSTNTGGWLARNVVAGNAYEFPLGAVRGFFRYRPITVFPNNNGKVYAKFQNYNPVNDGYDPFTTVNSLYYHALILVPQMGTTSTARVKLPFNSVDDGSFETFAIWNKSDSRLKKWDMHFSLPVARSFVPTTDMFLYSETPMSFASGEMSVLALSLKKTNGVKIPNVITPNGDGVNDRFRIDGLDTYQGGAEIIIHNRWGSEVYHSKAYTNNWSAEGLNAGTYYYVVKLKTADGTVDTYKGWIQVLR